MKYIIKKLLLWAYHNFRWIFKFTINKHSEKFVFRISLRLQKKLKSFIKILSLCKSVKL